MRMFSLSTYEDYILNTVVKSSYAKNSLTLLLMCGMTTILKFHLSIVVSALLTFGNSFDLVLPIFVSVFISVISGTLFKYIETHKPTCELIVDYVINNYSKKNFLIWKRIIATVIFCYIMIPLSLVTINNSLIMISIIQTAISFTICDCMENGTFYRLYSNIRNYKRRRIYKKVSTENLLLKSSTPPKCIHRVEEISSTPPMISRSRSPTPPMISRSRSPTPPRISQNKVE